ncbi:MAG: hypothetical protein KDB69_04670 [Acidimicrobiia bacterium]|nr:hypothetical protein [Acidimicrobiia bacterium]
MDQEALDTAVAQQRADRSKSYQALVALEDALDLRLPRREGEWKNTVASALDTLITALNEQARYNRSPDSMMAQIAVEQPRFGPRIAQLETQLDEIRRAEQALRDQLTDDGTPVDLVDLRSQLAVLDSQYRLHRAAETDLIYEAINVDLGGKG